MFSTLYTRTFTDSIHYALDTPMYPSYLVGTVLRVKRTLYRRLRVYCLRVYVPLTLLMTSRLCVLGLFLVPTQVTHSFSQFRRLWIVHRIIGKWLVPCQRELALLPE